MDTTRGQWVPGLSSKINLVMDLVWMAVSLLASSSASTSGADAGPLHFGEYSGFCALVFVGWWIPTASLRHYDPWSDRSVREDLLATSALVLWAACGVAFMEWAAPSAHRFQTAIFLCCFAPAVLATRLWVIPKLTAWDAPAVDVLILGVGHGALAAVQHVSSRRGRRRILGYLGFEGETQVPQLSIDSPSMGPVEQLEEVLRRHPVGEVYLAADPKVFRAPMQRALETCQRWGVACAVPSAPWNGAPSYVWQPPFSIRSWEWAAKRIIDVVVSALGLLLLLPLLIALGLCIKLTSRGPVFFRQTRLGLNGRPFQMLKFRSMVVNAEDLKAALWAQNEQTGPVFKMQWDPRVTRVGRVLRKYSLDELPQLFNVLLGEMSVVGPRPPLPSEYLQYQSWQCRRLSVRPGLTCLWQVSGRNTIGFEEWMRLDMRYIDEWSLWGDLALIAKTVPVLIRGSGA